MTSVPRLSRRPGTPITFLVDSSEFGGAEAYVAGLLEHLPDRFERELVASSEPPRRLLEAAERGGARITVLPAVRGKWDAGRLVRLWRALAETRSGLVHANLSTAANNRHGVAIATLQRRPVVATLHVRDPTSTGLQLLLLRLAFGRAAHVIAVSRGIASQLEDDLGVRTTSISLIRNGVEPAAATVAVDHAPVRVAAVGRLTRQKGFDLLIDATRLALGRGASLHVRIAGDGPDESTLLRRSHGLPVDLLGFVDDPRAVLADSDIFCLPSRWEGLPFALLDAMMCGLPCIATSVGDVPDALGRAGVVVPPDDVEALAAALVALGRSAERRRELGQAARERALGSYSLEAMVDATARVYDAALGRCGRG